MADDFTHTHTTHTHIFKLKEQAHTLQPAAACPAPRRVASPHPTAARRVAPCASSMVCYIALGGRGALAYADAASRAANARSAHWLAAACWLCKAV